ncbi:alcohol dehydrogenase [Salinisphaera orenii MK-B5]|uniref:Alcohol dehydrogenase n=2 Tax=Salinisphaera orenii TaxID=856731 RepID=A0A423PHA5_9GAMM|nr:MULTISPECIES: zinc-dependent alcohol dehydrogenase family protein [Salinisphaera]ROO24954.1 alcohol dehydrogenase [Salinisphaera orenii MK-B5]ROO37740.1 alcohol dehydrogenase [Salinisphaera halophila YIM 95161]
MQTRAAVLREMAPPRPYDQSRPLTIETFELGGPQAGEVLLKVHAAGLCHSDLSTIDGNRPRPVPMVLGHEAAGEIVEVGPGVTDFAVGDHVVCSFVPSCGHCAYCADGRAALCTPGAEANNAGTLLSGSRRLSEDGRDVHHHLGISGFAEYAVVARESLVKVDPTLDYDIAAVFGCAVLTGVGALIHTAGLRLGQTVLVVGLGGVGLSGVLGAIAGGAAQVIAADIDDDKLGQARALGATATVNTRDDTALEQIRDLTGGGVDIAAEFAGAQAALEFAYAATAKGGTTVTAGLQHPDARMQLPALQLVAQERTLMGSYLGGHVPRLDIPEYIALYQAGRLPVDRLLTHRLSLDEINTGFERLAAGEAIRQVVQL